MKLEVVLPQGVSAVMNDDITISGPKGKISRVFSNRQVKMTLNGNKIELVSDNDRAKTAASIRSIQRHLLNMVNGVQKKFFYKLTIIYSHFPITVALKGKEFVINNFLGERNPRKVIINDNVTVNVKGKDIFVESCDKEAAGIIAGLIENKVVVRNRDRRIYQDGIYIVDKGVKDE